jgi:hypothetical protein
VKSALQEELTQFLKYRKLKTELDGESLQNFGFVFDPIVSVSAEPGIVQCATSAYLSVDGSRPFASNRIEFEYSLAPNLNSDSEFVLRGAFGQARETARLLYENAGVLDEGEPSVVSDYDESNRL